MDTYDTIEMDQYRIDIAKLIRTICHLQDYDKKYFMAEVETNKKYIYFIIPIISQTNITWKLSRRISK